MKGVVVKNTGSWYGVEADEVLYDCRVRGKLRLKGVRTTNPIAVGDVVEFEREGDDGLTQGVITAIEPRRNYIIRRSTNLSHEAHVIAANVDNVFLVVTLDYPSTPCEFIDRFLVTCEIYKVPVTIVMNKMDLFVDEAFREVIDSFKRMYQEAGYEVLEVSALDKTGVELIEKRMIGKTSLFSGNSGVGKSTIIQVVTNDLNIKTGDVSESHHKGKHTTTFSEMFKIEEGGYLIDTPGIKGFGLVDIEKEEIARYFPDLFRYVADCRFYNCTHTHEPGCAVKAAVEGGELSEDRYSSYLKILNEESENKYR